MTKWTIHGDFASVETTPWLFSVHVCSERNTLQIICQSFGLSLSFLRKSMFSTSVGELLQNIRFAFSVSGKVNSHFRYLPSWKGGSGLGRHLICNRTHQ